MTHHPHLDGMAWQLMAWPLALLLLSLGLPWSEHPGWSQMATPTPRLCSAGPAQAGLNSQRCTPTAETHDEVEARRPYLLVPGARHPGRFGVIAGLVMAVLGWRRRSRSPLWLAALTVGVCTTLSCGLNVSQAGPAAAWLATMLLAIASAPARHAVPLRSLKA